MVFDRGVKIFGSLTVASIQWTHGMPSCGDMPPPAPQKEKRRRLFGNGASRGWLESWIYGAISLASAVT